MQHAAPQLLAGRLMPEVSYLAGVLRQVEQLAVLAVAVDGDLVSLINVAPHVKMRGPVVVLGDGPRPGRRAAAPRLELVDARHDPRDLQPRGGEKGDGQVDKVLDRLARPPGRHARRPADDERQTQQVLVVMDRLGDQAVLAQEVAVVRREHNDGVVGQAQPVEGLERPPDLPVHEGHHAVVAGDILPELFSIAQMAVAAVNGLVPPGLLPVLRVVFLGLAEVDGIGVVLALADAADGHVPGVVHARPRLGDDVRRVRIVVAGPYEERPALAGCSLDLCYGPLARPSRVVELLRQRPAPVLADEVLAPLGLRRLRWPGLEVVLPVGQAVGFHPDPVVLPGVGLIGVVAGQLDVLEAVPGPVEVAPEVQVAQRGLAFDALHSRPAGKRLEVGLADQRGEVTGLL